MTPRTWSRRVPTAAPLAFEFLVLTAARWGEVRWAAWTEIDPAERLWTVPATRMKAKREHRVPLCRRAPRLPLKLSRLCRLRRPLTPAAPTA